MNIIKYIISIIVLLNITNLYADDQKNQNVAVQTFLTTCVSSRGDSSLLKQQAEKVGFVQMPEEMTNYFLQDRAGQAWMIVTPEGKFVLTKLGDGTCSLMVNRGNAKEIQESLESWLPPKSTDLTYHKKVSKDKNLITTVYGILNKGKPMETWIYSTSLTPNPSLVAIISQKMDEIE